MTGVTYDTGALLAAEAGRTDLWALHRQALTRRVEPVVPTVVLAQAWRGGPQPLLSRLLKGCLLEPFFQPDARAVGSALSASATRDVIDAAVVVSAMRRGNVVVTSDPDDLYRISEALGGKLVFHVV